VKVRTAQGVSHSALQRLLDAECADAQTQLKAKQR
jgi:hypothetical protein